MALPFHPSRAKSVMAFAAPVTKWVRSAILDESFNITVCDSRRHTESVSKMVPKTTSRNTDVRDTTERDLKMNALLPVQNTIGPMKGYAGSFTFPDGPENQRPVTFQNGVYMTAGQDKGIWLNLLFFKTSKTLKHLVFVDDELKNLQNVQRALKGKTSMTLCRYGKVDDVVREFNESAKSTEIELWKELQAIISKFH